MAQRVKIVVMAGFQIYAIINLFLGLVLDVIIVILLLICVILLHSLLVVNAETRTFELGSSSMNIVSQIRCTTDVWDDSAASCGIIIVSSAVLHCVCLPSGYNYRTGNSTAALIMGCTSC